MAKLFWTNLNESDGEGFGRGTVFRCQPKSACEEIVDLMLISFHDAPSGHALIVTSGPVCFRIVVASTAWSPYIIGSNKITHHFQA